MKTSKVTKDLLEYIEDGVKSTTRTEEEKEADREFLAKMAAQGKKVVF